jgi:acyl-CoA reductase-like NAD-dependent aldehyde dehydrogenase
MTAGMNWRCSMCSDPASPSPRPRASCQGSRSLALRCCTGAGPPWRELQHTGQGTLGVVLRDPIGVVSIITPWNFPFLIVSQKLPFALAAGCTAVVKPSEMTSGSTFVLGEA